MSDSTEPSGRSGLPRSSTVTARPRSVTRSCDRWTGSTVYGLDIPGRSDRDEMGIYIEPPDVVFSPLPVRGDYVYRSQPEGRRSGQTDTDLIMYGLRKYLRLAIDGNPTVLLPLFAPESQLVMITDLGHELRSLRKAFLSRQAVERFLERQIRDDLDAGRSPLPERPDVDRVLAWSVEATRRHWGWTADHQAKTTGGA